MQINHKIFLLVAQELNFSRAAAIACVTQQCASDHIRRLELQYNVKLFSRKPSLALTPAGVAMQHALNRIYSIETDLAQCMAQYHDETRGSFTVGISASRARMILPLILPQYYKEFPNVEVNFLLQDTVELFEGLKTSQVDMFFGVNTPYSPEFLYHKIWNDQLFLLASTPLLRKHMGVDWKIPATPIPLSELNGLPFTRSLETSTMRNIVDHFWDECHVPFTAPYNINDIYTQIALCAQGFSAALCPSMLLSEVHRQNHTLPPERQIQIISIQGMEKQLRIELVQKKDCAYPNYVTSFAEMAAHLLRAGLHNPQQAILP